MTVPRMSLFTCTLISTMRVRLVDLEYVKTGDMLADGLTKALALPAHREFCKTLEVHGSGL
jgi:hypothetical protein